MVSNRCIQYSVIHIRKTVWQACHSPASLGVSPCQYQRRVVDTKIYHHTYSLYFIFIITNLFAFVKNRLLRKYFSYCLVRFFVVIKLYIKLKGDFLFFETFLISFYLLTPFLFPPSFFYGNSREKEIAILDKIQYNK